MNIVQRLFSLEGKSVIVTGASGGIGRALAVGIAEAGAQVVVHGTSQERLDETRRQIEDGGGRAFAIAADVGEVEACRKLIADSRQAMGGLDVLVNCAGMNRRKPVSEVTQDDFDTIMNVNLRSVFFLSQAAHAIMKEQGHGKILQIGSLTSSRGLGSVSVYAATKAGMWGLTQTMAVEWARDNVQVNCLAPGFIVTPLTEASVWADPYRKKWLLDRIPARRPGRPDDLIGAAIMLIAPASDYLTGQLLSIDGGYLAGGWWAPDERPYD